MTRASGLLAVMLWACSETPRAPTQVIVLVGGDPAINALDVEVYDQHGNEPSSKRTLHLDNRSPSALPTSFTIVPAELHPASMFRLVIQGKDDQGAAGIEARARMELVASFTWGHTTLLPIVLSEACARERCCSEGDVCERSCQPSSDGASECAPIAAYASLAEITPGSELDALQTGLGGCARGFIPDATGKCRDLDECAFGVDACSHAPRACVNLPPDQGRYRCQCPPGYAGTGEADSPCTLCDGGPCD